MEMLRGGRQIRPAHFLKNPPRACSYRLRPLKLAALSSFRSYLCAAKLVLPRPLKGSAAAAKTSSHLFKEKWLQSISSPLGVDCGDALTPPRATEWVVGIDPDSSGAVALLKFHDGECTAQVFDTPHLQIMVGKRSRRRPDARSIILLLQSFGTPLGTVAYIEQSIPFPCDGKQGWWSGGYNYGLWIGILVASGYSVLPVPPRVWKDHFELSGTSLTKDDSRKAASLLFPSVSCMLKRKKDHGRAEALLIAAYGKNLKVPSDDLDTGITVQ